MHVLDEKTSTGGPVQAPTGTLQEDFTGKGAEKLHPTQPGRDNPPQFCHAFPLAQEANSSSSRRNRRFTRSWLALTSSLNRSNDNSSGIRPWA
jgi:hypothetical protein